MANGDTITTEKIELRAAAARLLYGNDRSTADYDKLIEYIDHSERVSTAEQEGDAK